MGIIPRDSIAARLCEPEPAGTEEADATERLDFRHAFGRRRGWFHKDDGDRTNYWYAAAGASLGKGPKAPQNVSVSGGARDMSSAGKVHLKMYLRPRAHGSWSVR